MNAEIRKIKDDAYRKVSQVLITKAKLDQKHNVGDIISDDVARIKVEVVEYRTDSINETYKILYIGTKLTKNDTPYKDNSCHTVIVESK